MGLGRLKFFYYYLPCGIVASVAIFGIIFSLSNFDTTASAEQYSASTISSDIDNLPEPTAATYADSSLIDSTPTTIIPTPEDLAAAAAEEAKVAAETATQVTSRPVTTTTKQQPTAPARTLSDLPVSITAGGRTNRVSIVEDTSVDPGNEVKLLRLNGLLTGFYFGHNRANVFGGLANHHIGDQITITAENGSTKTYTIQRMEWLTFDQTKANMTEIAFSRWNGVKHAISIMTCTSSNYYGGRLIIFAD